MKKYIISILLAMLSPLCASAIDVKKEVIVEDQKLFDNVPAVLKKARWIWPNLFASDNFNKYAQFRDTFNLKKVPARASLYITADQNYRLYVNGIFVNSGPARGYQHSMPFDEIDVAKFLREGKNVIAIRAYNLGGSNFQYLSQGVAGLLYALDLGEGRAIVSRGNVPCRVQNGCERDTAQTSIQTNRQEHIDLRLEDPKWAKIDFDDSKWGKPEGSRVYNAMPYYSFEVRGIPMPEQFKMNCARLVALGEGDSKCDSTRFRNVCELADLEKVKVSSCVSQAFADVPSTQKGKVREYLFDFGKMLVGFPVIKIEGAKGGEIIDIIYDENVDSNLRILNRWATHSAPAFGSRVICREGSQEHQFFHLAGYRYALVRVKGNMQNLKITPSIVWSAYPLGNKGVFKTSDSEVQKIWDACVQTQRICALDAYVDTPYREQVQWWGDARVQAWNTFFISGDAQLLRRGIRSISMQKVPNGLTYGHAPTMAHHCILPDFSLVWILTLYDYYWQTGSLEAYTAHKDTAESIIKYFETHKNAKTGLVEFDPRYWLFLDWTRIQKNGQPAVLNLWYLYTLEKLTEMCAQNGLPEDAKKYADLAKTMRASIEKNLLDGDGLICDGILNDGKRNTAKNMHAQVLGKMCNIKGLDFAKAKEQIIMPMVRDGIFTASRPSSYWVVYVLQELVKDKSSREVFNFIKKYWKPFADFGTAWENYPSKVTDNSFSHAWSAHPTFLFPQILGGITQLAPAWKKVSINPNFFVDDVEISYPTPQGDLKVSYKKKSDGSYDLKIDAPKGMEVVKQ